MLKLKKVAVTGGIAAGKTSVCKIFEELGSYVVSADSIAHQLLSPTTILGKEIIGLLGNDIISGETLDRQAIARKVFGNPSLLEKLEKKLHPEVKKAIEAEYQKVRDKPYPLFVAEIPLLFESGFEEDFDTIILVIADEKKSKERFMKSTAYDADEFDKRNQRLLPIQQKSKQADFIIENNGSFENLRYSVESIFNSLKGNL